MPSTIAATYTIIGMVRPARFTSAGPGQIPERPQPIPNSAEPVSSGASISLRAGHENFAANSGALRRCASAKPAPATMTAPAMTKASVASHAPKTSRKPSTFSGSVMPEINSPSPKTKPQLKLARINGMFLPSETVTRERNRDDCRAHENQRRDDRARGDAREAADPVAGGAAIAHTGADPDQKAGDRVEREVGGREPRRP